MSYENESLRHEVANTYIRFVDELRPKNVQPFDFDNFNFMVENNPESDIRDLLPNQNAFYVDPRYMQVAKTVCRVEFNVHESLAVGRDDSRNNVFFGTLALIGFGKSNDIERHPVAVKPFIEEDSSKYLASELRMISKLKELGIDRLDIIGLLKKDDKNYLMSSFQPEMITLDSIDWKNLDQETFNRVLARAVSDLSRLHQNGLYHGDARPRNLTIQPDTTKSWYVDLEHGSSYSNSTQALFAVKKDLDEFYKGLCQLLNKEPSYSEFVDLVFNQYESTLMYDIDKSETTSGNVLMLIKLLPIMAEELRRSFDGEPMNGEERRYHLEQAGL